MTGKMLQMRKYKQLTLDERVKMFTLRQSKSSITQIASALGRSKSTISRELTRNASPPGYLPDTAQGLAKERRRRGLRLDQNLELQQFVVDHLCSFQWSPEQIAGYLKHRQTKLRSASHETIYAWIYTKPKEKLWRHLLRRKAKRFFRKYRNAGASRLPGRTSIHDRPECIGFGHFEGDLMSFRKGTQNMLVFHERKTRFIQAMRLTNKTAQVTAAAGLKLLKRLPKERLKSLTLDNGGEFAKHTEWVQKLGLQTYFCDPYASWQKGGVENSNGRLRRDLPRKTDLHALTEEAFDEIILTHNLKPRKCLNWINPLEAFHQNLYNQSVALQA